MKTSFVMAAFVAFLLAVAPAHPALGKKRHHAAASPVATSFCGDRYCGERREAARPPAAAQKYVPRDVSGPMGRLSRRAVSDSDPRPGRWCAWWLRRELGIPKSAFRPFEYNLARAFRYIGSAAKGPGVGVIVVWRSHVGIITGRAADGWIVTSGNDDHAVRTRARSLRGAIAFRRWPGNLASR